MGLFELFPAISSLYGNTYEFGLISIPSVGSFFHYNGNMLVQSSERCDISPMTYIFSFFIIILLFGVVLLISIYSGVKKSRNGFFCPSIGLLS